MCDERDAHLEKGSRRRDSIGSVSSSLRVCAFFASRVGEDEENTVDRS